MRRRRIWKEKKDCRGKRRREGREEEHRKGKRKRSIEYKRV